jgi:hypothetical protein
VAEPKSWRLVETGIGFLAGPVDDCAAAEQEGEPDSTSLDQLRSVVVPPGPAGVPGMR